MWTALLDAPSSLVASGVLLFSASCLLCGWYKGWAPKWGFLDIPNHRSMHASPTPRGVGFVWGLLWHLWVLYLGMADLIPMDLVFLLIPGSFLISLIGWLDDRSAWSSHAKLIAQALIGIWAVYCLSRQYHAFFDAVPFSSPLYFLERLFQKMGPLFAYPLLWLIFVWSINLYNFMDGADGYATLEGLYLFGAGGLLAIRYEAWPITWLCWGLSAILLGFLFWNKPKARLFMGDAGSCFLGFLVPMIGLVATLQYGMPILIWMALYGLFWLDATVTLLRRCIRGANVWEAHQEHWFQKIRLRWGKPAAPLCFQFGVNAIVLCLLIKCL